VRPQDLYPLLAEYRTQPIVLIHAGFPWLEVAAYAAAALPFVHIDVSAWQPWATLDVDRGLNLLLGMVPTAKILYGSDEASEPELLWLSARFFKRALSRVLDTAVSREFVNRAQAQQIAIGVLGANTERLHGIASP
jgi:predicted TIM-barrel fold metal-dependent hydrolase